MKARRRVVALCAAVALPALAAWPGRARGQAAPRRIGILVTGLRPAQGESAMVTGLVAALGAAGLAPGLRVEVRYGGASEQTMAAAAAALVALPVDVIVAALTPAAVAARRATAHIPIVMAAVGDPVGNGLVASLARPGGNVTGLGSFGQELAGKNLELLREWLPQARRVAVLGQADDPWTPLFLREVELATGLLGLTPLVQKVADPAQYASVFAAWARQPADALLVQPSVSFARALPLARQHRLPSCSFARGWVTQGGLFAYAPDTQEIYDIVAGYVRQILDGRQPAELPVQQATRFGLHLNAATARALGLSIPKGIRLRATEVIE